MIGDCQYVKKPTNIINKKNKKRHGNEGISIDNKIAIHLTNNIKSKTATSLTTPPPSSAPMDRTGMPVVGRDRADSLQVHTVWSPGIMTTGVRSPCLQVWNGHNGCHKHDGQRSLTTAVHRRFARQTNITSRNYQQKAQSPLCLPDQHLDLAQFHLQRASRATVAHQKRTSLCHHPKAASFEPEPPRRRRSPETIR